MLAIAHRSRRAGLTMLELVVVLAILVALAGTVIALLPDTANRAVVSTTQSSLVTLRVAMIGGGDDPGYRGDVGALPTSVADLLVQPSTVPRFTASTATGWRGPYLLHGGAAYAVDASRGFTTDYGDDGDPAMVDGWGNPIVLQYPKTTVGPDFDPADKRQYVRLVSAGPDGVIDSPASALTPADLTDALRDDDIVLFLNVPDSS